MAPIVYVLGSSNMDLITVSSRIPIPGETIIGKQFFTRCGGKGANQAVAVAKLCDDSKGMCFVSTVGDDSNGCEILKRLESTGVITQEVKVINGICTGVATICIDEKGENSIIVVPGANSCFSPSIFDEVCIESTCKVFVLQLEIPIVTIKHILTYCKAHGIFSILNPAPASSELLLSDSAFECVDYLIPNETESQLITGMANTASPDDMMDMLVKSRKHMTVIMTLGGEGAFVGYNEKRKRIPCPHVNVKDTVGAGDCFVGTFAYLLACQLSDHPSETVDFKTVCEFVQKSCYASSYSVQYDGGFDKYPTSIIDEWNSSLLGKQRRRHLPPKWVRAKKIGKVMKNNLIACKCPLDSKYTPSKKHEYWTPQDLLSCDALEGKTIGMVIDLTMSQEYYDGNAEFASQGIEYVKYEVMGNGCNVPEESIRQCTKMIHEFLSTHEDKLCVVHCTHGYNRTGLIICTYLNEYCGMTLNEAVSLFKEARPPGIYRTEILSQLEEVCHEQLTDKNKQIKRPY